MQKKLFVLLFWGLGLGAKAQNGTEDTGAVIKKWDWNGSLGTTIGFSRTNAFFNNSNPFSWSLNGDFDVRFQNDWDIPINFNLGKYQNSFAQPLFQFSISPHYKWATLYAGSVNLTFNPYTLGGTTFGGVGTELNPGNFRFAAMYGQFTPAVEIDTTGTATRFPSFRRMGYGAKIGYGTEDKYVDLIFFHAKDNPNSISSWKDPEIKKKLGDAFALNPQENNVIGLSSKYKLTKDLSFIFDGGLTFLNTNIADSQNTKPKGLNISNSDALRYAGKVSVGYNFKMFSISANYERIAPNYLTLGSYFFNNDIENITLSPVGTFLEGKGSCNFSIGLQKNNLDKTKTETTKRFIGSGSVSYTPTAKWNLNLNYNNFSIREFAELQQISDSFLIRQVNQTFTFTPTYTIKSDSVATHTLSFTTNYNDVNDRNILTKKFGNMKSTMFSINHSSFFSANFNTITSGLNYNQINTFFDKNTQVGISAGYSQRFFKQKFNAGININGNISYVNKTQDGSILNGNVFASYTLKDRHMFTFNSNLIQTNSNVFDSYTQWIGNLSYRWRLK